MLSYRQKITELFLQIEGEVGATGLNGMVLLALEKAVHNFHEKGDEDFFAQFYELLDLVKNTEPRIALVIDNLYEVWKALLVAKEKNHPEGHLYWEKQVLSAIKCSHKIAKEEGKKITKYGVSEIRNNDVILIHSVSRTVLDVLFAAKKIGKDFRVIIAEQESEKTHYLIEVLSRHDIRFQVVPEYMLSHIESEITKIFLGGITINNQMNVVGDAGSNAIVSEFHLRNSPIYLFISTRKFSLWKSRASHHAYKVKSMRSFANAVPITFERIKFSHDRIHLKFYDWIISEKGKMDAKATQQLYQQKFDERAEWRKEFFRDEDKADPMD
ncbi:MAG: hypothetical protein Q8O95_00620 [bacterium]|nr:hypothetical protein [bacterium]